MKRFFHFPTNCFNRVAYLLLEPNFDLQYIMVNKVSSLPFLKNGGEIGELMRTKDWSNTAVGTPDTWPQSLRTSINLLLNSKFPMFVWWGKELTTFYNDGYRTIAGGKHPDLLGKSGREGWAEIWDDLSPLVDAVFNGQSTWAEDQLLLIDRRGFIEESYFTFSYSPIVDESGTINGLFCAVIETTEKVLAAHKVEQSERNLRATILQSPVAMCILKGPSFVVEIANNRIFEIWGREEAELLNKPIFEGLPEARNQGLEDLLNRVLVKGETINASEQPVQLPRKGEIETRFLNFVYEPFRDLDGTISGIIVVAVDVTEQVLTRHKVEEGELRFRSLADNSPMIVYMVEPDAEARMSYFNKTWLTYTGQGYEEALGRAWDGIVHPEDVQGIFERYVPAFQNKEPYTLPAVRLKRHDGQYRWHLFKGTPRYLPTGEFMGYIGVGIEIHEQIIATEALKESEARANAAIEIARLGTFEINVKKHTIIHSPRSADILGLDPTKQWPYQTFIDAVNPEDQPIRQKALEIAKQTGVLFYEARIIQTDQNIRWVRLNGHFVQPDSEPLIIGTLMDITEERKAAELLELKVEKRTLELALANKALMQSNLELSRSNSNLEEFAHAASHDMKEPIRKVLTFTNRLKLTLRNRLSEKEQYLFDRVENAAHRMGLLVDDLLEFSKVSEKPMEKEEVNLNVKVNIVLSDLELIIEEQNAEIEVGQLPTIKGYKRQLQQLLQNILSNALKYSKPKQTPVILISSRVVFGYDVADKVLPEQKDQKFHLIEIKDNGIGFKQEYADKIFKMFQRLHGKEEYSGTGIGLSIARKVVENHNGFIWAESQLDEGAIFYVLLPA
ncbi:PAS domain S-box-containing protein [Cnuella takakiae]|uniref:histidine kinase n=1 Tax=Cnuella takakiae TaxID=1302690 RepID=A0A1M5CDL3_9BACT|nr:PAS domain S-box protein [Cnuella takakiae]OLY91774.1 hypothetical protein BUE76_07595 [Cnuella takakiae]SHF52805.1 PAS domain S-box-containing protein [Cnuella takakiae]